MRSAVILLAVVCAVGAEAPYHLPRPGPHAPAFVYPSGPAPPPPPPPPPPPLPAPFPQLPQPRPPQQSFAPQPPPQSYTPSQGYNYQQPSFRPEFVQPAPPPPQPIPALPPPPPVYLPAPQPQPLPLAPAPPQQISYPQPVSYPQPISYPQPQPVHYPQPQPPPPPVIYQQPQPSYGLPQIQPQPQPLPNFIYNVPQAPAAPVAPLPAPIAPQAPFISNNQGFISHHHSHLASQGYSYPQPIAQPQFIAPIPLQSQPLANSAVTSYQADSNQYSSAQAQIHREALDDTVVNRVQNIIKESEHSSARDAGYLSLVSGVSLENAKPSVEISSFIHSSTQNGGGLIDARSASNNAAVSVSSSSSAVAASPASSYDVPTFSASNTQSSDSSAFAFLPQKKPAISYGAPN